MPCALQWDTSTSTVYKAARHTKQKIVRQESDERRLLSVFLDVKFHLNPFSLFA